MFPWNLLQNTDNLTSRYWQHSRDLPGGNTLAQVWNLLTACTVRAQLFDEPRHRTLSGLKDVPSWNDMFASVLWGSGMGESKYEAAPPGTMGIDWALLCVKFSCAQF